MKNIFAILMIAMLILTGCSPKNAINNDGKTINVWYYEYKDDRSRLYENITDLMEDYGSANGIKVIINRYTEEEISYDDYVLKRNLAIGTKEADIILDQSYKLYSLRNKCGDYSRIDGYGSMWSGLKDRYCILLGVFAYIHAVNGQLFDEYNVDYDNVITEDEYFELKWKLRNRGVSFELNNWEYGEIIEEYSRNPGYVILGDDGTFKVDKTKLNEVLDRAYKAVCMSDGSVEEARKNWSTSKHVVRDNASGIELSGDEWAYAVAVKYTYLQEFGVGDEYLPDKPIYMLYSIYDAPSLFISEVAPQAAYDVATVIFTKKCYRTIQTGAWCGPIVNEEWARAILEVDENWKYTGRVSDSIYGTSGEDLKKIFDLCYEKIADGKIFDRLFISPLLSDRYYGFLNGLLTTMDKNDGKIANLDERIKNFEMNLNMR